MLSAVPERILLRWRTAVALGWLLIIASLFWDPFTPALTAADALQSPFRLHPERAAMVQGQVIEEAPYALGNRIFWTLLVPLIPLFLMIAGHEAWRRICPLSWWSQLPRRLGLQRTTRQLNRRTGAIDKPLALLSRQGWWRRHVWLIQFSLLFAALNARLLFINADRMALGVFLLAVISAALAVGWLWGGKTWCNAVCPVGVVQRIYAGPGGLLESQPHLNPQTTPQSMCRKPGADPKQPDVNVCVGCTPSCPDVDLEKAYWESVDDPHVRWVHYGFLGLVWGFYTYYWAYSGNWGYYLSGVWTHETTTWTSLTQPGFALATLAWIPKWAAAPLFLGACVAVSGLIGVTLERLTTRWCAPQWPALDISTLRHRCLIVSAWLSINSFYLFGGRPTVLLMPTPVSKLIDIAVVTLTTLWLMRAWRKQRNRYRKESVLIQLRKRLETFPIRFEKLLDGRGSAQLNADEADVLIRTLPAQAEANQKETFRQAVARAHAQHQLDSPETQRQLEELRALLAISPEEHTVMLAEFGWTGHSGQESYEAFSAIADNWLRLDNHRIACEAVLLPAWHPGLTLTSLALEPDIRTRLHSMRDGSGIDDDEHRHTLAVVSGLSGSLAEQAMRHLGRLTELAICSWELERAAHELQPHQLNWPSGPWLVQTVQGSLARAAQADLFECVTRLLALGEEPQVHAKMGDAASLVPERAWVSLWEQPSLAPLQGAFLKASTEHRQAKPRPPQPSAWARALAQAATDGTVQKHQRLQRCLANNAWDSSLAWHLSRQLGWAPTPIPIEPSTGRGGSSQPTDEWQQALHADSEPHENSLNHLSKCIWLRQMPLLNSADWPAIDALGQHCQWITHPARGVPLDGRRIWLEVNGQTSDEKCQSGFAEWPHMTIHGLRHLFAPADGEHHARRQGEQPTMDGAAATSPAHAMVLVVGRDALQATVRAHTELGAKWLSLVNIGLPGNTLPDTVS